MDPFEAVLVKTIICMKGENRYQVGKDNRVSNASYAMRFGHVEKALNLFS